MAAETTPNTNSTEPANAVDTESKMARLKRLNPQLTEEQWEMVEKYEDPEENGLILVGETLRTEDGQLIIDSYYTDAINPLVNGQKEYSAATRIFSDGTTDGVLLVTIYMGAKFEYNSDRNEVIVVDKSTNGFALKQVDTDYPHVLDTVAGKPYYENNYYPKRGNAYCTTSVVWGYGQPSKPYNTTITVNARGEQISSFFTDIKP